MPGLIPRILKSRADVWTTAMCVCLCVCVGGREGWMERGREGGKIDELGFDLSV